MIVKGDAGVEYGPANAFGLSPRQVMSFYKANWNRRISLEVPEFYQWQFIKPPESHDKDWNCVAVRDGEVLGVMGLNPRPFALRGAALHGAELTTWAVSQAARGLGIGRGILRSVQDAYDVCFGFGISDAALPVYMTQGFRRLGQIPRYFRILNIEAVRPHARIDRLGERLAEQWARDVFPEVSAKPVPAAALGNLGAAMDRSHNLFVRTAEQLAWRYDFHPAYRYEAFLIESCSGPERIGLIIREDEIEGLRFLHVLDLLGDSKDVPLALAFIEKRAHDSWCGFVDFYCTSTAVTRHLLAAGWFSTNDDPCFQLSHLFYPPEIRDTQTTSMVYWSRDGISELGDLGRLYLTKEDLDLDRPTLRFYEVQGLKDRLR